MKQGKIQELHSAPSKAEKFLLNILSNRKKLLKQGLIAIMALFLLFAFTYFWSVKKNQEMSVNSSKSLEAKESELGHLKKLKTIAKRYPTLQTELDASLAQAFLNQNQLSPAKMLLKRVEKRQLKGLPFIQGLNEMTFLIEDRQYKKALSLGKDLLQELESHPQWSSLYALHLVRLIELEKLSMHPKGQTELQMKLSDFLSKQGESFKEDFQLGRLNLVSYSLDLPSNTQP